MRTMLIILTAALLCSAPIAHAQQAASTEPAGIVDFGVRAGTTKGDDARYERYFSNGQFVTIGVFYKDMEKPVEALAVLERDFLVVPVGVDRKFGLAGGLFDEHRIGAAAEQPDAGGQVHCVPQAVDAWQNAHRAAAQRRGIDLGDEIIRIGIGEAGKSIGDMRLFQVLDLAVITAGIVRWRTGGNGTRVKARAFFFRQLDDLVMAHRARCDQGHAAGAVLRRHIGLEHVAVEGGDGFFLAQDRPAQRLAFKDRGLEMVEHDVVGRVSYLPQFLQHHLALALQLGRFEGRVGENVPDHVQSQRHIFLQHPGMEGGLFAARIGIEHAAHSLDLFGNGAGRTSCGTLERHVFQHV